MKLSCGCGIVVGIIIGILLCGAVAFFIYSRSNPEKSVQHIERVEKGWDGFKAGGDKSIKFVKESIHPEREVQDNPESAPQLPMHPQDNSEYQFHTGNRYSD